MSFMRSPFYVYRGSCGAEDVLVICPPSKPSLFIPVTIFDELVVMRYAQMTKKERENTEKGAIEKHRGNISCDALCKKHGVPNSKLVIEKIVDRKGQKRGHKISRKQSSRR